MFSSKPKFKPGVPYEVQRVYDLLSPKPKELIHNASNRRFIMEGEVGVFNHKERRTKRRYLFLFNDILLVTKKEGKKSYWLKIYISLRSSIRVEDVPDSTTKYKVEFRIYAPKKTIILFTSKEEQKIRWINEIRKSIEDPTGKNRSEYNPNDMSAPPSTQPPVPNDNKKEEIKISGDIGKIEIPGVSDNYGDIPTEDSDNEDDDINSNTVEIVDTPSKNIDLYADVPLPPTPNSTPVLGSGFDDFDSIANRNSSSLQQESSNKIEFPSTPLPQLPQQPSNTTPQFDPFANSQPLQPVMAPSANSILQPIPSNSTPSFIDQPNNNVLQPQQQNPSSGFDALKSLDMQGNTNQQQGFYPQMNAPSQMFTQNAMSPPSYNNTMMMNNNMQVPSMNNMGGGQLSVEEQMKMLSMNAPTFGNQ